jgi:MFS family permease
MTLPAPTPAEAGPFDAVRRGLTIGLLLAVTVTALAALALVTIAPLIPAELGRLEWYGWLFSGYLLAALLGSVWAGGEADRRGLRRPFGAGLALFAAGLALAGAAPSMAVVIAARALQGFGGGALTTCVYVAITRAYPDHQRSRLMALLSSAWVTPALVGPALAGAVAEAVGWRWVFLGLVPVLGVVAALTLPRLGGAAATARAAPARRGPGLRAAVGVVLGLGVALAALSAVSVPLDGGTTPEPAGALRGAALVAFGLGGAWLGALGLRRLLPPGTLRLAPGLGALVAARGAFFAAFIGIEAFLALMLTELHGLSSAGTGAVVASGAITWAAGSWWQARRDAGGVRRGGRAGRVGFGIVVLGVGLAAQGLALAGAGVAGGAVVAAAVAGWMTAGFGIGVAHATSSVLAFALAEDDGVEPGSVSAALQLTDNVGAAMAAGLGGAALAWVTVALGGVEAGALRPGVAAAFGVAWVAWLLSYVASRRTRPAAGRPDGERPARVRPAAAPPSPP